MHEEHERDLIHLERAVAFPHLDVVEAVALAESMLDRGQRIGRQLVSKRDAREAYYVLVGHRGVAVNADFRDGLYNWRGNLAGRRLILSDGRSSSAYTNHDDCQQDSSSQAVVHLIPCLGTVILVVTSALR